MSASPTSNSINFFSRFSTLSSLWETKWDDVRSMLKELIGTFNLTAQNITLDQKACIISCLTIFHILSRKEDIIKSLLTRPDYVLFEDGLLSKFGTTKYELNNFVDKLITIVDDNPTNTIENV